MEDTALAIALEAKGTAEQALSRVDTHEAVCAERYAAIRKDVHDIKKVIVWGVSGLITVLLGVCGVLIANAIHIS